MTIKFLTISLSILIFILVIELIRREKLTFKYALGWLFASFLSIVGSIFDSLIYKAAYWMGFQLPSNFIFFAILSILVFLSLLLTIFLCQQSNRNDTMAQKIGLLEFEIDKLKEKGPSNG